MPRRVLRVRVVLSETFDDDAIRAFCRYHGLNPNQRRAVREHLQSIIADVGRMGLEEQIHEGRQWLAGDKERADV